MSDPLERLLREQRVVICCGSGGVGKTTTSATLALKAALLGRRAVVCTIDPARRLANSLGLSELGNEVVQVDAARFAEAGVEVEGALFALMLDTKRTFDRLIERYTTDPKRREAILNNKFYQQMSNTVVGSSDYMAMEKLYELSEEGDFDLIVLDTPPTKHALDFLQAPERMKRAFDRSTLEIFLRPWAEAGKRSFGFIGRALGKVVNKVDALIGVGFVKELAEFFQAFEGLYDGFRTRADRVDALLRDARTSFVVVTAPQPLPLEEAGYFCDKLREFSMDLSAVVVNRVEQSCLGDPSDLRARIDAAGHEAELEAAVTAAGVEADPLLPAALKALLDQERLAKGDRERIEAFAAGPARGVHLREVPRFTHDIYDLSGLLTLSGELFGARA
ncbi:MAG: ArsA family ATPase [Planctomycetes bacterium]|nr:ArsA family ATPase [Planctomycetota bacterium]